MNCPACTAAQANPQSGLYFANCEGCDKRALRQAPSYFNHMQTLKRYRTRDERREYLDGVVRSESQEYADLLKFDFAEWFEAEKAKREGRCKA